MPALFPLNHRSKITYELNKSKLTKGFLGGSVVKNLPAVHEPQETWVQSLCGQSTCPLEEGMATHSSIGVWRIPMERGAWWATVHGVAMSQTQLK